VTVREWCSDHPWIAWPIVPCVLMVACATGLEIHRRHLAGPADRQRGNLRTMTELAETYRALKARSSAVSRRTAEPGALDLRMVQQIAGRRGLSKRMRVSVPPARAEGGMVERVVDLTIRGVRRQDLALFLRDVEARDPAIRAQALTITRARGGSPSPKGSWIDAKVVLAAHERSPQKTE